MKAGMGNTHVAAASLARKKRMEHLLYTFHVDAFCAALFSWCRTAIVDEVLITSQPRPFREEQKAKQGRRMYTCVVYVNDQRQMNIKVEGEMRN